MSAAPALVRGWCPGALRPMETGDGWLVRVHPRLGRLSAGDAALLARLAREAGNSLVDLTARGNLQIRGVRPDTHGRLAAALVESGLVAADEGEGPYRLALVSPLAGRDPAEHVDSAALAAAVEAECAGLAGLPPKTAVAVDGGGLPLTGMGADLTLRALAPDALALGLPDGRWLGALAPEAAPAVVRAILCVLAGARSPFVRRLRDLAPAALDQVLADCGLAAIAPPPARLAAPRAGILAETGGTFAALVCAPFGRLDAAVLERIAHVAEAHGADGIRLSPGRALALTGLAAPEAARADLAQLGLITDPADPRLAVAACPGAPACSRGQTAAQDDAAMLAEAAARHLRAGLTLHVSGCAKGCARPGIADVTLVGQEDGLGGGYGIVAGGTARQRPLKVLTAAAIAVRLAAPGDPLANLMADPERG